MFCVYLIGLGITFSSCICRHLTFRENVFVLANQGKLNQSQLALCYVSHTYHLCVLPGDSSYIGQWFHVLSFSHSCHPSTHGIAWLAPAACYSNFSVLFTFCMFPLSSDWLIVSMASEQMWLSWFQKYVLVRFDHLVYCFLVACVFCGQRVKTF